jgi:alpha-beta hydrolase superfamily lysophospholipase/acyl carrier protein
MPLLRSGKIDRQALPEPVAAAAEPERRGPPPATATEETIARAWREEIGIGFVSLHDNFFELGGDSLGVVKVAARLEQEAGILLDAEQMMIQSLGQLAAAADGGTSDHAAPGAGPDRTTIAPRLFGPAGAELYGCLHPAADPAADCGVLVCPPLGHEYIFTHRALRHTAHKLAAEGIPVLRFDYPGTGDSAGEEADVTLAGCVDGIVTATAELGEQTGVSHVHLLGLRLGASLAAMAAPRLEGLAGVVLWDPVTDGQAYLRELTALHRHWLGRRAPAFRTEADGREVGELLGFPLSRPLHDAIAAVGEGPFAVLGDRPILWIDSTEDGREAERAERLGQAAPGLAYRAVPYPEIWNQDPYKARLPHAIIDAASAWIGEQAR